MTVEGFDLTDDMMGEMRVVKASTREGREREEGVVLCHAGRTHYTLVRGGSEGRKEYANKLYRNRLRPRRPPSRRPCNRRPKFKVVG